MPQDLPDWTRQTVGTQTPLGSVGPVANGGNGSAIFNVPKGTQTIGLRTSSTGGIGGATLYQVQGHSTRVLYVNGNGTALGTGMTWFTVDSSEDTQIELTVTPPVNPAGTATAWLIASSLPLTPTQTDISDRPQRLLGMVYGSQVVPLQQRAVTTELLVQLRSAGAEIDPRDVSDRSSRLLGAVRMQDAAGNGTVVVTGQQRGSYLAAAPPPATVVDRAAVSVAAGATSPINTVCRIYDLTLATDTVAFFALQDNSGTYLWDLAQQAGLILHAHPGPGGFFVSNGVRFKNDSGGAVVGRASIVCDHG